jgi:hypothetical protein
MFNNMFIHFLSFQVSITFSSLKNHNMVSLAPITKQFQRMQLEEQTVNEFSDR